MTWTGVGVPCQRWRDGSTRFAVDDVTDLRGYSVDVVDGDREVKAFVERHHYARSYPAARLRVLLTRGPEVVGAAVFSHPPSERVLACLPCERMAGVELGRLVLLDGVPGNGESWFVAQCFRHLRAAGIECLLSHSDPVRRRAADGSVVMPGHVGRVYQATNAVYAGRTRGRSLALLPDGTVFSERSMSKIRGRERGWRYCVDQLVAHGAAAPAVGDLVDGASLGAWMWRAIRATCRRLRHGGNHRYVWAVDRRLRRDVAAMGSGAGVYPKQVDDGGDDALTTGISRRATA